MTSYADFTEAELRPLIAHGETVFVRAASAEELSKRRPYLEEIELEKKSPEVEPFHSRQGWDGNGSPA